MAQSLPILIAEDDENDVFLLQRAIRKAGINDPIQVVGNGQAALDYLCARGPFMDRSQFPFPRMLITDLKMPGKNGFDVLAWLRDHKECKVIPVIVFSSSNDPRDVKQAYELGVNAYLLKPSEMGAWEDLVAKLFEFWRLCQLPVVPNNC